MEYKDKLIIKHIKGLLFDIKIEDSLPAELMNSEDLLKIDETLRSLRSSIRAMGVGDLSEKISGKGYTLGVVKSLQAALKNLTWQTKAIASGDFSQRIDYLGEFSIAFNIMVENLELSLQKVQEGKELFEMVFETIPDATVIISFAEGEIFAYNNAFCVLTGYQKEQLEGENINNINFFQNHNQQNELFNLLKEDNQCHNMAIDLLKKDDSAIRGLLSAKIINIENKKHILSVIKDITELNKMENKLKESEERHRLLADNASDVIWTMDLAGAFTYISPSVTKLRGFSVAEIMHQTKEELLCPSSLIYFEQGLTDAVHSIKHKLPFKTFRGDLEQPCKDGTTVWTDTTVSGIYDKDHNFIGMVGVSRDVTERKKMEEKIKLLSVTDNLTQLFNRLKLDEILNLELERVARSHSVCSVCILDIDYFKSVNDRFGHLVGDSVLVEFASILKKNIRKIDIVGRWGGEEFMIIMPLTDIRGGFVIAEKLRKEIAKYKFKEAGYLTASFGVSEATEKILAVELVARADIALYQAKNNGRNKVVCYQ